MKGKNAYANAQLARALIATESAGTETEFRRASKRLRMWKGVQVGMQSGRIQVGSRTPIATWPAWVTPEVARGGFATGYARANEPFADWERELAQRSGVRPNRASLNAYFLGDDGQALLAEFNASGAYVLDVPENGALLSIQCLVSLGQAEAARSVLGEIAPLMGKLRFYPRPDPSGVGSDEILWLKSAAAARERLTEITDRPEVSRHREAVLVWKPFTDRVAAWWHESILQADPSQISRDAQHQARVYLLEYDSLRKRHSLNRGVHSPKGNLALLLEATVQLAQGNVSDRARSRASWAVKSIVAKRGLAGTEIHARLRQQDLDSVSGPTKAELATAIAHRLETAPDHRGIRDIRPLLEPVSLDELQTEPLQDEQRRARLAPKSVQRAITGSLEGDISTLRDAGLVGAAESLAALAAQYVAPRLLDPGIPEEVRRLHTRLYRAFRRRRSLLLLNLEHQVRPAEVPWIRALGGEHIQAPRYVLGELAHLYLEMFPGTLMPNSLVSELNLISEEFEAGRPFLEELAADIFTGRLSTRFYAAAEVAANQLQGTLYSRYFAITDADWARFTPRVQANPRWWERRHPDRDQAQILTKLAQDRASKRRITNGVASNGAVIEEIQVLTAHNLLQLDLLLDGDANWTKAARDAAAQLGRHLSRAARARRPLADIKNAAYANRQLVFYLTRCEQQGTPVALETLRESAVGASGPLVAHLVDAALTRLEWALSVDEVTDLGPTYFYGWSASPHPLFSPPHNTSEHGGPVRR